MLPQRPPRVQQALRSEEQQEWLHARLAGTVPGDYEEAARFCSTFEVTPPPAFASQWAVFRPAGGEPPNTAAILGLPSDQPAQRLLIFSDPSDAGQVEALAVLAAALDALGDEAPPMLWVPHTRAPAVRTPEERVVGQDIVMRMMETGIDGIIFSESQGLALATVVAGRFRSLARVAETLSDTIATRRSLREEAEQLDQRIENLVWNYLGRRCVPCVPPVDPELEDDGMLQVPGVAFGQLLARGARSRVYEVTDMLSGGTEAMKVIEKRYVKDWPALQCTKRMVETLTLLSMTAWLHPNVTRLHRVFHAPRQLLLLMEYGGHATLYTRLLRRHGDEAGDMRPLTCPMLRSIVDQMLAAVTHLHLGPGVCHRDIKPESFVVEETGEQIRVQLTDFDLAVVPDAGGWCRTPCGTLPFTAPEVLPTEPYIGFAADLWSLGLSLLEVMCGVRIIETVFNIELDSEEVQKNPTVVTQAIYAAFQTPGDALLILEQNVLEEVRPVMGFVSPVVDGLVNVRVPERWTAERLREYADTRAADC